jgi:DNA mismatch endonuclease (patch repair protein)
MRPSTVAGLRYPVPTNHHATVTMRANRRARTSPELALRSALHAAGLRFRIDYLVRATSGSVHVDVAFPRRRIAVFIDGCFWHACPIHGEMPQSNQDYWQPKLQRNRQRDERNNDQLLGAGWRVIRVWEHEPTASSRRRIVAAVREREIS